MKNIYKYVVIGFPLYLLVFELLFNFVSDTNISDFFAPSLAASGLGLMINGLKRKKLEVPQEHLDTIRQINPNLEFQLIDTNDDKLISFTWIALIIGILIWYSSCSGIHLEKINSINEYIKIGIPYFLGIINYVAGATITFIKD
jgi:hypothetical protein